MAFEPERHEIDPRTGFIVDRETGHPTGLVPKPVLRVSDDHEWPKWVLPHASHIVRDAFGNVAVPSFPEFYIRRHDGEVTVLVHDADEEAMAFSAAVEHTEQASDNYEPDKGAAFSPEPSPSDERVLDEGYARALGIAKDDEEFRARAIAAGYAPANDKGHT
jgi:hypothetical protein